MAKTSFLDDLAKRPPQVKIAILLGAIAVLGLGYWQLRYSGLADERKKARSQSKQIQDERGRLNKDLDEMNQLIVVREELDKRLERINVTLPESSELPSFFLNLQKQAAAAGVNVRSWKRVREEPVESYVRVPVEIEVSGTFYQINRYLYLLHGTDRIITIEDFNLSGATLEGEEIQMRARFRASTFREADVPPDTTLPPAGQAPAGGQAAATAPESAEEKK